MKLAFHDYTLRVKGTAKCRQGALIRFSFGDCFGYTDCHPWTECGDLPLEEQKTLLMQGKLTPLTAKGLFFAKMDAQARRDGISLLPKGSIKSHHLMFQLQEVEPCDYIKVKLHEKIDRIKLNEMMKKSGAKWRFDFNSSSNYNHFCSFLENIDLSLVDFIEDPFSFDEGKWRFIEEHYGVQLAADFEKKHLKSWTPSVLIIKPAIDWIESYRDRSCRKIVTSYVAHPFEQVTAAFEACQLGNGETMGLLSHPIYEDNPFSNCFSNCRESFFANLGTGFGFDEILQGLNWHD